MKHAKLILLVTFGLSSLALSGCANLYWAKDGASNEESNRDAATCDYEAQKATANISNGWEQGTTQARLVQSCMGAKGYTQYSR